MSQELSPLTFRIDPQIALRFPDIKVAILAANIENPSDLTGIVGELSAQVASVVERVNKVETLTQLEEIAVWRQAYGAMSIKPSKFHSSIEALLRRVKKGDDMATGLPVVDLYNLISVIHGTPMGAYDQTKLPASELELRLANTDTDQFAPLGGRAESFPLNDDLIVYAMGSEILCWGFNTRDSSRTCVDENSQLIIFMSESTCAATNEKPFIALSDLAQRLTEIGVSVSAVEIADSGNPEVNL